MIKFPELEEKILNFWKTNDIFHKSVNKDAPQGRFVFFEGPPTANGKPGIHHVLARAFKDLIPRYKTMLGFKVERKAGWDTQGLPVELQVEKELKFKGKPDIEKYGVAEFNAKCKEDVWKYKADWEKLTERIGFWLDLEHPYVTYENYYIESLWWIFKKVWEAGLLYQDYKVLPHCPRCGTALSSHEVALGYKKVKEPSVYIKFKLLPGQKIGGFVSNDQTYILSWTTTPWTLPGNVALAVSTDIKYEIWKQQGESLIVASQRRLEVCDNGVPEANRPIKGKDLVGLKYQPLYDIKPLQNEKSHQVYAADFVTTEDGTGVVHTAVMYGEDDFVLGTKVGLPKYHTVDENGNFTKEVSKWFGKFVKDPKVERAIVDDLENRGLLLKEEMYTHDYPFCWRCSTPLLYYAKPSWFIKMSVLREDMKKANAKINWYPEHIRNGRFGEWLEGAKDWAISRERYWGTPLPIWKCEKCNKNECIGSFHELYQQTKRRNTFLIVRHGEARTNADNVLNGELSNSINYPLTTKGQDQIKILAKQLDGVGITKIVCSPFYRTRQTADIIAQHLNLPVVESEYFRELAMPGFEGQSITTLQAKYPTRRAQQGHPQELEESSQITKRMLQGFAALDAVNQNETILVVSHGDPMWFTLGVVAGQSPDYESFEKVIPYPKVGQVLNLPLVVDLITSNGEYEIHRPQIDAVTLTCVECGGVMHRIPEVADCWFDSGAMPFAQWGYPHLATSSSQFATGYPADYIAEAIDQTRGWFYTLLAIATLLKKTKAIKEIPPYKNVICLGHINDKHGQKMSKSKGNMVDPWEIINRYGADALRWHFYTMNQPGEAKNFDPQAVEEVVKKNLLILMNVLAFYELHQENAKAVENTPKTKNVLDNWILSLLQELINEVTAHLDEYEITEAGRKIASFITNLSQWYVRRCRDRYKEEGDDKVLAKTTLGFVLRQLSILMAPFTPFVAEELYSRVGGSKESVHLEAWPATGEFDNKILDEMIKVREVVEVALAKRADAKIKVRQPLRKLEIKGLELNNDLKKLLADEVNVMTVEVKPGKELIVTLDIKIDDELKEQGLVREFIRQVNALRKKQGLTVKDRVHLKVSGPDTIMGSFKKSEEQIIKNTLISQIEFVSGSLTNLIEMEGQKISVELV